MIRGLLKAFMTEKKWAVSSGQKKDCRRKQKSATGDRLRSFWDRGRPRPHPGMPLCLSVRFNRDLSELVAGAGEGARGPGKSRGPSKIGLVKGDSLLANRLSNMDIL
jgi:hypothetical protein